MHNIYNKYQCPYWTNASICNSNNLYNGHRTYPCPYYSNAPMYDSDEMDYYARSTDAQMVIESKDYGSNPFVTNITEATKQNNNFRTALWTGAHLQLTLMSIPVGEDIGLEVHPNVDQFIRIESGQGLVKMGDNKYKNIM